MENESGYPRWIWLTWGLVFFITGPGLVEPFQLPRAMLILILGMTTLLYMKQGKVVTWSVPKFYLWIGLLLVWSLISMSWAYNRTESFWSIFQYATPLIGLLIFSQLWRDQKGLPSLVGWLAWLYALIVGIQITRIGWQYGFTNQDLYRIQFPAGHKSLIAAVLVGWFPFLLQSAIDQKWKRAWVVFAVLLLVLLQSRAGYLALLAFGFVYWLHQPSKRTWMRWMWLIPVLILLLWWINPGQVRHRINPSNFFTSATAQDRMLMWQKSLDLWREHPFQGFGFGQWKLQWPSQGIPARQYYADQDREVVWTRAHNDWLETAVELGLPGILFLLFLVSSIWYYSKDLSPQNKAFSRAMAAAYLIFSVIDFPRLRMDIQWIYFSWWMVVFQMENKANHSIQIAKRTQYAVLTGLTVLILYGAMRYWQESLVRQLWHFRNTNQPELVIKTADQINKLVLDLDEAAVPIDWYAGMATLTKGDQDNAFSYFIRAKDAHPYQHNVWNNLGVIYFQRHQLDSAIVGFRMATNIAPFRWEYTRNLANAYAANGDYQLALDLLSSWPGNLEEKETLEEKIRDIQRRQ